MSDQGEIKLIVLKIGTVLSGGVQINKLKITTGFISLDFS